MSKEVDQQIVKMEFDNKKFEKNVKTSLGTIERLKKALNFDEQTKTMKELERAANKLTIDDVGATLEKLTSKFSAFGIAGMTVVSDLTKGFENLALKMGSALTAPLRQIKNGGWSRAMKIKDAEFTMKGLNILGDKLKAIKEDIDYAVSGTAYGYESAASAAAQFAASNVQIGDSMKTALRSISGIAAQTNSSYDEIAGIFTTIAANGKVMTQQLRQLSFRGMNASAVLAKAMHTSEAAVSEMVSKGKIDFETFAKAMDDAFGEHAKAANETFKGALDNMKASLSRVGADFQGPWIDFQRDVFNSVRIILNSLRKETGAFDAFFDVYSKTIGNNVKATSEQKENMRVMTHLMNATTVSIDDNTEKLQKRYDTLSKITNRTKEQDEQMEKIRKHLENAYKIDADGTAKVGNEINKLLKTMKESKEVTESQKILLESLKTIGNQTSTYVGQAAENAMQRAAQQRDKLKEYQNQLADLFEKSLTTKLTEKETNKVFELENRIDETAVKLKKLEKEAYDTVVIGRTNSVGRLVATYNEVLAGVRVEVLNFLNDPRLIMGINNFVDGLNNMLKFATKLAKPIKNAWRSIFPEQEAETIFRITENFKKFTQQLRLSAEGSEKIESIFRGVASALSILRSVVGDAFGAIKTIATPAVNTLIDVLAFLGEIMVTIEWRFRQFEFAVKYTIKYFADAIKKSKAFKIALSGLLSAVSVIVAAITVLAKVVGSVIVIALVSMFKALDKLVTNLDKAVDFLTPLGNALKYVFSTIGSIVIKGLETIIGLFGLFSKVTKKANKDITGFGNNTLTPIQKLVSLMSAAGTVIRDFLVNGLITLGNALANFSFGGFVKGIRTYVIDTLNKLKDGILNIPEALGQGFAKVVEFIINSIKKIIIGIGNFVKAFLTAKVNLETGETLLDSIKNKMNGAVEAFKKLKKTFEDSGMLKKFKDTLKSITDVLNEFFSTITPAKLFAVTFTAAVALMTVALFNLINSISMFMTFATQVPVALSEMLRSIKTLFSQLTARIAPVKKASTQFKEIAEGIGIVAAAIYFLGQMKPDALDRGILAMYKIITALGLLMIIFKFISLIQSKKRGPGTLAASGRIFTNMLENIVAVAGAIALVGVALNILAQANFTGTVDMLNKVGAAILALAGVYGVMAVFSKFDKGVKTEALTVLAFAGSLYLIVMALEKIQGMPISQTLEALKSVALCIGVLAVIAVAVNAVSFSSGGGLLLTILALYTAVPLLKKLSSIDFSAISKSLMAYIEVIAIIALIAGAINLLTRQNIFKGIESLGKGMMGIASSMLILIAAIALLGNLDSRVLFKGIMALGHVTAMIVALELASALTVGTDMKNFSKGVLILTFAFVLMSGLVAVLGSLDLETLAKGVGAIACLTGIVIAMMWATKFIKKVDFAAMGVFISLSVDILALTGALVVLAQVPWQSLAAATAAMSITLYSFGVACQKIFSSAKHMNGAKGKVGMFIMMTLLIIELAASLYVLSQCPWEGMLAAGGAMSLCLLAYAKALSLFSTRLNKLPTDIGGIIVQFAVMMLAMAEIAVIIGMLSKYPWENMLSAAVSMSLVMIAMAGVIAIMRFVPWTAGVNAAVALASFVGVLYGILTIIDFLGSKIPGGKEGETGLDRLGGLFEKLGEAVGKIVGGFMEGKTENLETIADRLNTFATKSQTFFDLMDKVKEEPAVNALNAIGTVINALVGTTGNNVPSEEDISKIASNLSTMAQAIVDFSGVFTNGEVDTLEIKKQADAMQKVLEAIAYAQPLMTTTNADGYETITNIDFKSLGPQLEALGESLVTFSNKAKDIDDNGVEKANVAMGMINAFSADIPNSGGTVLKWLVGDNEVGAFADGLLTLGPALLRFSMAAKYIDNKAVEGAAASGNIIAGFAANLPRDGGWDQVFKGKNDISGFAAALPDLGTNLKAFSENAYGMRYETAEVAANTLTALAAAATEINKGGMDTFKNFAENLPTAGSNINSFFAELEDGDVYDNTKVTNFCYNVRRLADLNTEIASEQQKGFKKLAESIRDLNGAGLTVNAIDAMKVFKESMTAAVTEINDQEQSFIDAGVNTIKNFTKGLDSEIDTVKSKVIETAVRAKGALEKYYDTYFDIGLLSAKNYARGLSTGEAQREVTSAANTLAELASKGTTTNQVSDSTVSTIMTNVTNAVKGVNERASEFGAAASSLMSNFIGGLDAGITTLKDYGEKITDPVTGHLTKQSTLNVFKQAGSDATEYFAKGIASATSHNKVVEEATAIGKAAVKALDTAIADPAGVSDETYYLGNAFSKGFAVGIKNSTKEALKAAAKMAADSLSTVDTTIADPVGVSDETYKFGQAFGNGYSLGIKDRVKEVVKTSAKMGTDSVKALDTAIHDPKIFGVDVSLDTFNLGKAAGAGYQKGIEVFNGAVKKAAEILGINSIKELGSKSILENFFGSGEEGANNWFNGLIEGLNGIERKDGDEEFDNLFGKFFEDLKTNMDEAVGDVDPGKAIATGDGKKKGKKGGKGSKKAAQWTKKDVAQAMTAWLAITDDFTVKYDAFNKSLIEKGKITVKYLAQSVGGSKKLKELLKERKKTEAILKSSSSSKEAKKAATKRQKELDKQIKEESKKGNDLRKAVMAFKDSDISAINREIKKTAKAKGVKEGTKAYAKIAKDVTSERVKEINKAYSMMQKEVKAVVGKDSLVKIITGVPSVTKTYVKNYSDIFNSVKGVTKKYKELANIKSNKKANKAMGVFGNYLYHNSEEYKKAAKQLPKDAKKLQELQKKANKQRDIINDPKAKASQKQAAKQRLETYKQQAVTIKKEMKSLVKEIEKGPEKAIKKFRNSIKATVKDFLSFSNISFDKVLSGFDRVSKSTNLQTQAYDIFTHSLINTTEAAKTAADAYGLLNVNIDTGINLLERFSKISTTNPRRLMRNAESQLKAYKEFRDGIAQLQEAGLDQSMIKQLEEQGTASLSSIRGFLKMSPEELAKYNTLIKESNRDQADATKKAMDEQVKTYESWVDNLSKLAGKIPENMLKSLRESGVSNADFVETLLYMDDETLKKVSAMYADGVQKSVDAAVESVSIANEGKTFKETIEKNAKDYVEKESLISKFKDKGFSEAIIERFKSLSLTELQAYFEELKDETTEGIKYINKEYEKSLYGGKSPIDKWLEDMQVTNDAYNAWDKNMNKIKKELGADNPLYLALKDMGMEGGAEYADAFIKGTAEQRERIVKEFERQQDINSEAIVKNYRDRIQKIKQWKADIEKLANMTYQKDHTSKKGTKHKAGTNIISNDMLQEIIEAGPDAYESTHALVEMTRSDLADLSMDYEDAMKLPSRIADAVTGSYVDLVNNSLDETVKTIKGDESKKKVSDANKETITAAAEDSKKHAVTEFKKVSRKAVNSGLKSYLTEAKGKSIGENVGKGLANGLISTETLVVKSARKIAKKSYLAMKNELKVESPSKLTEELGKFVDLGFVKGLEEYSNRINTSAVGIGDDMLTQFRTAMVGIDDYLDSQNGLTPTIHPTFDLSEVARLTSDISAQMNATRELVVTLNDKANSDVIRAIDRMSNSMDTRIAELSDAVDSMQIYLDSGALVGELAKPMDNAMGKLMASRRRGM